MTAESLPARGRLTPSCRPNLVGDPNAGPKTAAQWFNTAAFQARRRSVRQRAAQLVPRPWPGEHRLSFIKRILIGRAALELRLEVFNPFNRVNFGVPVTDLSSSAFGRIQATATDAREFQFGVKFRF